MLFFKISFAISESVYILPRVLFQYNMSCFRNSVFMKVRNSIINSKKWKQHVQEGVRFESTLSSEGRQSSSNSRKIGKGIELQNNGENDLTIGI